MIATTSRPAPSATPADRQVLRALLSRPYPAVMGVLNITPDSFSDGGQFIAPESALAQARRMIAEGADIIDIGAESTRPYGAQPVTADEELQRLRPILAELQRNPRTRDEAASYVGQNPGHAGRHQPLGDPQTQHFQGFRAADPSSMRKFARTFAPRTNRWSPYPVGPAS